jgi:oligosaccharyltransferase complex subunit delta (ribophorin II)
VRYCANQSVIIRLSAISPLSKQVSLGATDSLKILLTTTDGKKAKRPHQAFLTLTEKASGLEESFVFSVKDNGKGKVELVRLRDLISRI